MVTFNEALTGKKPPGKEPNGRIAGTFKIQKSVDEKRLAFNIPANFIASCESTLKRYNAAKTDAERRAVLDRQTVQGLWWAIGFASKIPAACMSEKELNHAIRLTRFRGAVCPVFQA